MSNFHQILVDLRNSIGYEKHDGGLCALYAETGKELYHQHIVVPAVPNWLPVDHAWVHIVGLAQLLNMPRTNFFICDKSKPFYPLQDFNRYVPGLSGFQGP